MAMDPAVGRPDPERSSREAELFQQRLSWSIESEGLLDRTLVPLTEIAGNLERLVVDIRKEPAERDPQPDDLRRWHRSLFRRTGLEFVGRFRTEADGPVGFGVLVLDASGEQLQKLPVAVSPPDEIPEQLTEAFAGFAEQSHRRPDVTAAATAAAELWTYDWELAVARSHALRPDSEQSTEPLADLIAKRIS